MTHSEKASNCPVQRIVHIITSLEAGGAQRALYSLIQADCDNDAVVHTVLYFHDGPYVAKLHELGVTVTRVTGLFGVYDPTLFFRLTRVLYRLRPHLIHTSLWLAGVVGRLVGRVLRVPVLCDLHSTPSHNGNVRNSIDRWTARGARYCAVSRQIKQQFSELFGSAVAADDITVVHSGIDVATITAAQHADSITRVGLGIENETFVIGAVGRLVPVKQFEHVLWCHAMVRHELARLHHERAILTCIVGAGPEYERLVTCAEDLGIRDEVLFLGHRSDVYQFYPLFDCFVQPSDSEGISYALLEALACGVPAVVTSTQEHHEVVVNGEHGAVVPARQGKNGLIAPVLGLLLQPGRWQQVKDKNIALVRNDFARSTMVTRYRSLYAQLGIRGGSW